MKKMNLQNKSEFKKFVKSKLEDNYNISIIGVYTEIGLESYLEIELNKEIKQIRISGGDESNLKSNKKYCQWLTEAEDEVWVHYRNIFSDKVYCGLMPQKQHDWSQWSTNVTCKRCKKKMEEGK